MADDRPVEDTTDQVARLQRELDDLKSTVFARLSRKSTGDMEVTLRPTPKEHTIFLRGQTLNRADYPDLWQWVTTNNMVIEDAFGPGNGTTTFTVPDMQGRVPICGGTINQGSIQSGGGGIETYYIGRSGGLTHRFISVAVMPPHAHSVSGGGHGHFANSTTLGDHGGHNSGSQSLWAALNAGQGQFTVATNRDNSWGGGPHSHTLGGAGEHNHAVSITGGDNDYDPGSFPLDLRIPYMTVNWMLWV